MAEEEVAEFPFSIDGFKQCIVEMVKGLSTVSKKVVDFGKNITNHMSKAMQQFSKIAKSVMGSVSGAISKVAGVLKNVAKQMPEIGMTFQRSKQIMVREFLYPIRQLIVPYLQKMLDWVRDHRIMFAKWGTQVTQVLKVVIYVGKQLWGVFTDMYKVLTESLQKGLGTSFKSIDEFINVLALKVSVITLYMGTLIEALWEKIQPTFSYVVEKGGEILKFFQNLVQAWIGLDSHGNSIFTALDHIYNVFDMLIHAVGEAIVGFFEGLFEPLSKIMTPITHIAEGLERLLVAVGLNDASGIRSAFKGLGNIMGKGVLTSLYAMAQALDTVILAVQTLASSAGILGDVFSGNWDNVAKRWDSVKGYFSAYGSRSKQTWGEWWSDMDKQAKSHGGSSGSIGGGYNPTEYYAHDALITKRGDVVHLDPNDNMYAFKGSPSMGGNVSAPMTINISVVATEGNAQTVGRQIGESLYQSFSNKLHQQMMVGGY